MVTWEGSNAGADVDARLSDSRLSTSAQLSPEPLHTPHSSTSYPACTASMNMVAKASCTLCLLERVRGFTFPVDGLVSELVNALQPWPAQVQ